MIAVDFGNNLELARNALRATLGVVAATKVSMSWDADNPFFEDGLRAMPPILRGALRRDVLNVDLSSRAVLEWMLEYSVASNATTYFVSDRDGASIDISDASELSVLGPPETLARVANALDEIGIEYLSDEHLG